MRLNRACQELFARIPVVLPTTKDLCVLSGSELTSLNLVLHSVALHPERYICLAVNEHCPAATILMMSDVVDRQLEAVLAMNPSYRTGTGVNDIDPRNYMRSHGFDSIPFVATNTPRFGADFAWIVRAALAEALELPSGEMVDGVAHEWRRQWALKATPVIQAEIDRQIGVYRG